MYSIDHKKIKKCRNIMKIICDCHRLNTCKVRYKEKESVVCNYCIGKEETIYYVLFGCDENKQTRDLCWSELLRNCPKSLANELKQMPAQEKTAFLLSGMRNCFTVDWICIYEKILNFIYTMYSNRIAEC